MTLLERLRSAGPADFDRDAADVLGLRPGDSFRLGPDGLTVNGETVPLAVALAELRRAAGPPAAPAYHLVIGDLEPPDVP